jgi:hypothetical protein
MKMGAWIHDDDDIPLDAQIVLAAENGLQTIRSYHIAYAEKVAPLVKQARMSLFADMWVDAEALAKDWRSQLQLTELARYHELGVPLEAICVGNELREGGDEPTNKRFTARLAFGLANLIASYRDWLNQHGYTTPLTYAMEELVFDRVGYFNEWVWPLIDACDIISINRYPMTDPAWFTFDAFEESRRFLYDARERNERLVLFEFRLRRTLQELERAGKPMILSETGFPSAVGYRMEGDHLIAPETDNARYGEVMDEFVNVIRRVNADYHKQIQALYFYEWRDNLYHRKIWNEEQSPIHIAFGLCDRFGVPKFNIKELVQQGNGLDLL